MTLTTEAITGYQACVARLADYLARTGMTLPNFADRIGYSPITLQKFHNGRYEHIGRPSPALRKAIDDFIEQNPAGDVAQIQGALYETENVRRIRSTVQQLLPRPVAYMLYAPPGSQKTFVLQHEVARINLDGAQVCRAIYIYGRQGIRPRDLMRRICMAAGSRTSIDIETMLQSLRFDFRDRRTVLVLDEAQHLSLECLETIRELLDQPPYFSLLLAGSHDLKRTFDQFSATLEQWNSRIIAKVRLPGLERREARGIVEREIGELLATKSQSQAETIVDKIIAAATTRDAFENGKTYINVRTLTNALNEIRAQHQETAPAMEVVA